MGGENERSGETRDEPMPGWGSAPPVPEVRASAVPEPPAAPTAPAVLPGVEAHAPGGVYLAVPSAPGEPIAPTPAPKGRNGRVALVATGAVALGAIAFKFVLPIVIGTAMSGALGGVFGGPFEKLPGDQQKALEQRFETAMGDTTKGVSDAEVTTRVDDAISAGLPRLGDALLVERFRLTSKLITSAEVATCARIARATATSKDDADAMSTALGSMDATSIGRWFDINVSALEAEAAKAPDVRAVPQADSDRVFDAVFGLFTDAELTQLRGLYDGEEQSDVDACTGFRALYGHITQLPPEDLTIAALYEVTP